MERVWDACILCDGSGEVEFVTTTEVRQAAQETITAWPGTKTNLYMITYAVFGLLQRLGVNIDFRISTSED